MQSKKPTYKKPREQIDFYEESTWLSNDKPMYENDKVAVFRDKYPVTKGHLLFIPKKNEVSYVCLLYTSPSPRDGLLSRMPSSA